MRGVFIAEKRFSFCTLPIRKIIPSGLVTGHNGTRVVPYILSGPSLDSLDLWSFPRILPGPSRTPSGCSLAPALDPPQTPPPRATISGPSIGPSLDNSLGFPMKTPVFLRATCVTLVGVRTLTRWRDRLPSFLGTEASFSRSEASKRFTMMMSATRPRSDCGSLSYTTEKMLSSSGVLKH